MFLLWHGVSRSGSPYQERSAFLLVRTKGRYDTQETLKRCGIFLPLITEYLGGFAKIHYRDHKSVQSALVIFCEFLIEEGISSMEQVVPKSITRFLAWGAENDHAPAKWNITYISTFMKWLLIEGRREAANPVIPNLHYAPAGIQEPRPFEEDQMQFIWKLLDQRGTPLTRLVTALGEEGGNHECLRPIFQPNILTRSARDFR